MPLEVQRISLPQFAELLAFDPARFRGLREGHWINKPGGGQQWVSEIEILLEPIDADIRDVSADHKAR